MNRYSGKPLLRLLELYVLWCIGELSESDRDVLTRMTPKLGETYSRDGAWYEIIESVMDLPIEARKEVAAAWEKQRVSAATPQKFAEDFVDAHLT